MQTYIVLLLVGLMFLLLFRGVKSSMLYSPKKIKTLSLGIIIAFTFRYITLAILTLVQNPLYLYYLKPIFFINLISIPGTFMISYYIFSRNVKIAFNIFFLISGILIVGYSLLIIFQPCTLVLSSGVIYSFIFKNFKLIFIPFILFNLLTVLLALRLLENPRSNKIGTYMIIFSGLVTSLELLLDLMNMSILPVNLIGDIIWIATLNYSLERIKKVSLPSNTLGKMI